ncbi:MULTISPECIES: sugar transferase [unclassified Sphingomonas]|jgi:lipopolysaccharide/colanic/teichoic acid biosynthesis glycosyltransferase|uniref:sugar transferase n=1 Tax=Sphingomonas TaxID=13687 RepID=UPI000962563A|nr:MULTISPECIES: sugar transferase [unclassified Sphingomonas]MBN8811819.1 sugar transferase [Sphingomonas sp.]OJY52781.1 MAG: lipid carrier--UDP-N-acetylgalactosaminyltransferase [Sphingomonas sp. 67-41]
MSAFATPSFGDVATRALDIGFAVFALVLASPIFLTVVPLLRFTGEGAVFYRQIRIGRGGKPFGLLKFATMVKNAASIGSGELTLPNDTRVLPVGRFLRKTKLNELPQLINILTGDLSLIGPRPQTPHYFDAFLPEQRACVASVRPGLSGAGSVIFRDEETIFTKVPDPVAFDHDVIMPYKGEIECWFVAHRSTALYFELILATVGVVLLPRAGFHRRLLARVPQPPATLAGLL